MEESQYIPSPIDTSDITLPESLIDLREILAKNVHEVWAKSRIEQGWKYGHTRNDEKKEHPCLVPYERLSEQEKDYDRNTALETLRVIIKCNYDITSANK